MVSFQKCALAAAAAVALVGGGIAHAATITFGTPTAIGTGTTSLEGLPGTVVGAAYLGNTTYTPSTVTVTLDNGSGTINFVQGKVSSGGSVVNVLQEHGGFNGDSYTNTNANFQSTLVNPILATGGGAGYTGTNPVAVQLQNLTVGQAYTVQLFALDDRFGTTGSTPGRAYIATNVAYSTTGGPNLTGGYVDTGTPSATFYSGANDYVLGSFVADATTQNVGIDEGSGNTQGGNLNALVVRSVTAVPEPATLGIAGVGIAGLLLTKRRKARVA